MNELGFSREYSLDQFMSLENLVKDTDFVDKIKEFTDIAKECVAISHGKLYFAQIYLQGNVEDNPRNIDVLVESKNGKEYTLYFEFDGSKEEAKKLESNLLTGLTSNDKIELKTSKLHNFGVKLYQSLPRFAKNLTKKLLKQKFETMHMRYRIEIETPNLESLQNCGSRLNLYFSSQVLASNIPGTRSKILYKPEISIDSMDI
jgi:hypothetical protein